jgi:GntR family transcriptional regulator
MEARMEDVKVAREFDLRGDGTPIYVQLAGLFRRRIESGEWPVGEQIPTLDALALEFGVARATVRQTTGLLRQEGLVARYRGRGTIVIHRPQREFLHEVGAEWSSIVEAYRHDGFSSQIIESAAASKPPPSHDQTQTAGRYHYVRRLNRISGQPVSVDAAWIEERIYRRLNEAAIRDVPTLLLLHEMPGITIDRAMQTLTVATADVELSGLLGIKLNAALAVIHRTLYGADDSVLCFYESFNRGDTFRLKMRLR